MYTVNTVKERVFCGNNNLWHYRSPQGQEFEDALLELNKITEMHLLILCWK